MPSFVLFQWAKKNSNNAVRYIWDFYAEYKNVCRVRVCALLMSLCTYLL